MFNNLKFLCYFLLILNLSMNLKKEFSSDKSKLSLFISIKFFNVLSKIKLESEEFKKN